jgi:EAL and modified HD-GYP domain-containing signal transduction protein
VIIVSELATDKPDELVRLALVRAKFCELLREQTALSEIECSDLFLIGLFSLLDGMLGCSMSEILEKLPINVVVKETLQGGENRYSSYLRLSEALEKNNLTACKRYQDELVLTDDQTRACYLEAVKYSNHL